jgi:hypothetical protein
VIERAEVTKRLRGEMTCLALRANTHTLRTWGYPEKMTCLALRANTRDSGIRPGVEVSGEQGSAGIYRFVSFVQIRFIRSDSFHSFRFVSFVQIRFIRSDSYQK